MTVTTMTKRRVSVATTPCEMGESFECRRIRLCAFLGMAWPTRKMRALCVFVTVCLFPKCVCPPPGGRIGSIMTGCFIRILMSVPWRCNRRGNAGRNFDT